MAKAGRSGVTANTPKGILFGACTIHKNFNVEATDLEKEALDTLIGATSGGSKFSYAIEYTDIEPDGVKVKVKGLKVKTSETGTLEVNLIELTPDNVKLALNGVDGTSQLTGYKLFKTKADIAEGDYLENITLIGKTLDNRNVIFVMHNALCTSGLELEGKNKESSVPTLTFECHAGLDSDHDVLPIDIYYQEEASN